MQATNGFYITLSPNRLSVIYAKRGRVHQSESINLESTHWNEYWAGGLMRLDLVLRQLLSRFSAKRNISATLLYHSPTLTKQIYTFDQGGAYARDAARSKIREGIGLTDPVSVCSLGADTNANQPCTMLAFSDREETLRSLYAWLNRCGVRISNMIPSAIASIVTAASEAIDLDASSVLFYFDSDISIIAHSEGGILNLIRPADIGYRKLAESYEQVFANNPVPEATIAPDDESTHSQDAHSIATSCLFRFGIPFDPKEYQGVELRSRVLPCMAPVLQRIGIDIKQTIRFGISKGPELKNLVVSGPGSVIPCISKAVGEHLELHVHPVTGAEFFEPLVNGGNGSAELNLIQSSSPMPGLLPGIAEEDRLRKHLSRALVAGTAVAMLAMGGQYTVATLQQQQVEERMQLDAHRLRLVNSFENDRSQTQLIANMLGDIAGLVTSNSKAAPMWEVPLAEIGELAAEGVRIQEVRGEQGDALPFLLINGYALSQGEVTAGRVLDRFVEKLSQIDSVNSIKLGATSRIELLGVASENSGEGWGLQFTMRVLIETAPSPYESFANVDSADVDWSTP